MTKETANAAFYDTDASTYDQQRWNTPAGAYVNRVQQKIVANLCSDWRDQRVLEVGPGTARFSISLAQRGSRLTLLDISQNMLEVARRHLADRGLSDQIDDMVKGSIYELPFEDGTFDHALCLNVFNHLERAGDALRELARVVKPGSTLLFNYANLHSYYWPACRRINARRSAVGRDVYSIWEKPREVRRMIGGASLELVRRVGHVHVPWALERYHLYPVARLLDSVSRVGPLSALASIHYCLCRTAAKP